VTLIDLTDLEYLVWCDASGSVHTYDESDPEQNGPVQDDEDARKHYPDDPCWTLENRDDGYGKVWHYDCPGPHHRLLRGREL